MSDISDSSLPARRAADADRETTARRLRDAAADGRLEMHELDERLGQVYAAKTLGELEIITADLPGLESGRDEPLSFVTRSGSIKRNGYWRVPSHIVVECTSGSIKLDFTAADCPHREVLIDVSARSGSVTIVVPKGWTVDLDRATATSGSVVNRVRERPEPGTPTIRVTGHATSGTIKARYPRRNFVDWLLRRGNT